MTDEEFRLERVQFKRFMKGNIRFLMILCIICSILGAICIFAFKDRFIRDRIIMSVLVMYIVYIVISFVDLILEWIHRNNPVSTDMIEFRTTNNNSNKNQKGVKEDARRNNKDSK